MAALRPGWASGNAPIAEDLIGADGLPSDVQYLHADALGSVAVVTDATGAQVSSFTYGPWGETAPTPGEPFRWAGMRFDAENDFYYDHARYYGSTLRRFVSPDPSGTACGINLFAYAGNDPVNSADVNGLWYIPGVNPSASAGAAGGGGNILELSSIDGTFETFGSLSLSNGDPLLSVGGSPSISYTVLPGMYGEGDVIAQDLPAPQPAGDFPASQSSQLGLGFVGDALGKIWSLPNTALGLVAGTLDIAATFITTGDLPQFSFGNNALQISNLQIGPGGGITFGNVELFTGDGITPAFIQAQSPYTNLSGFSIGLHEEAHTYQAQALGACPGNPFGR